MISLAAAQHEVGAPRPVVGGFDKALVVILLSSAMFAQAIRTINDADRATVLAGQYFVWAIMGIILVVRTTSLSISSPIRAAMKLLLAGLLLSTLLVWRADTRGDIAQVMLQTGALVFMTVPFFVLHRLSSQADIEFTVLAACHVVFGLCILSVVGEFVGLFHYEHGLGRYFGFLGDQAAWAIGLPLIVYFSTRRFFLAGAAGLCLALTASRAPAFAAGAAVVVLITFSRGKRLQYSLTLLALAIFGLYQANAFSTLVDRISGTHLASSDRAVTARLGYELFEKSPLFGLGYNAFGHFYPTNARLIGLGILPNQTSTAVQMLSDGGLLLFVPFLAFVLTATVGAIVLIRLSASYSRVGAISGLAAWLLTMLIVNQSATWFFTGSSIGPLVLGAAGVVSGYWARLRAAGRMQAEFPIDSGRAQVLT